MRQCESELRCQSFGLAQFLPMSSLLRVRGYSSTLARRRGGRWLHVDAVASFVNPIDAIYHVIRRESSSVSLSLAIGCQGNLLSLRVNSGQLFVRGEFPLICFLVVRLWDFG